MYQLPRERSELRGSAWSRRFGAIAVAVGVSLAAGPTLAVDRPATSLEKLEKTHKQVATIKACPNDGTKLEDFCLSKDGLVLTIVSGVNRPDPEFAEDEAELEAANKKGGPVSVVRVFDNSGELVRSWDLSFPGQAINVGPDGLIYVGGDGRLAKFDSEGKLVAEAEAPQVSGLKEPEELRARAKEQLEAEKQASEEQLKQFEEQLEQLSKIEEESLDNQQRQLKRILDQQVKMLKRRTDRSVESVMRSMTARLKKINSIAVGDKDVYIACPVTTGYGYSVWRTNLDFAEPQQVITGLSGCCGQMDIQASGDSIFVAENSRHRVVQYDRDGNRVNNFGKRDREGLGEGFGGCCNPMNLCFTTDGALLVSESNGLVKHFTPEGKYVGLIGAAKVPDGCKNSAIGVSSDGSHVYYIDIRSSQIAVLERQPESEKTDKSAKQPEADSAAKAE